jgi:topoisomerase-4 subunit A
VSPDKTIDALFAFTACETSVAPLGCVIEDNKPLFIGVSDMLKYQQTERFSYKSELEIQLSELEAMAFLVFGTYFYRKQDLRY